MDRVQKILAQAGIASRRRAEQLIREGRVSVNGKTVEIGASAVPEDDIRVDGKPIASEKKVYILLNKPRGVTSTVYDPHAKYTVLDLVKVPERVYPVGRLDRETEGLLLLTNDGDLANRLMHPRYGVTKTYIATTMRPVDQKDLDRLLHASLDGRRVAVDAVERLTPNQVSVDIHEGRKHIVRELFSAIGYPLKELVRVRLGPLKLGSLEAGKWRALSRAELDSLKKSSDIPKPHYIKKGA